MNLFDLQKEFPLLKEMNLEKNYFLLSLVDDYGLSAVKRALISVLEERRREKFLVSASTPAPRKARQ